MKERFLSLLFVSVAMAVAPAAAAETRPATRGSDASLFTQERDVLPGARGPNRLDVDVPLLAGSRSREGESPFSDLRFFTTAGEEIPYLLVPPREPSPELLDARLLPIASTKKSSGVEADLGKAVRVDRLTVLGIPAPYLKRVRLEASGDRSRWTLLADEASLFDLPEERLSKTALDFASDTFRYFRLTWDDTSSARVPMPRAIKVRRADRQAAPPPLTVAIPFERRASEPGASRYHLRLPASHLPIRALELVVSGGDVLRAARVTEARLSGSQLVPTELGTATLRRAVRGELAASEMRVPITPPNEAEIEILVDDGSNLPLPLTEVRAQFAPLPRIAFESPDGERLLARYGREESKAPRYDLEAARESIADTIGSFPVARWGEARQRTASPSPAAIGTGLGGGAPLDVSLFPVVRRIPASPPGLTALKLDAALLSTSERLADLRIATVEGRQVPYLLETLSEPLSLDLPPLTPVTPQLGRRAGTAGEASTSYLVKRPFASLPAARLVVETPSRVFTRHAVLLVETPLPLREGREPGLEEIAGEIWAHADPDSPAPALTLAVPARRQGELTLSIDDGDNAPLPMQKPRLLLTSYRLRFFREAGQSLRLLCGAPGLEAPRYDLALLAPRLVGAPANEISLEPPGTVPAGPSAEAISRKVFWGILAGAVAILLALMVRLLGGTGAARG